MYPWLLDSTGLTLAGTGFEDPVIVHLGGFDLADDSRLLGSGTTYPLQHLPDGIPLRPISLSSAGGTSAPFDGLAVNAVVAVAAVDMPPNPDLPSANQGQMIIIHGRGFTPQTPIALTT